MAEAHICRPTAQTAGDTIQLGDHVQPNALSLVGLHLNVDGAIAGRAQYGPAGTIQEASSTIIFNHNGTISGRAQYGPSGDIPTPDGKTVVSKPPNTIIEPGSHPKHVHKTEGPIGGTLDDLVYYTKENPSPTTYKI